MHNVGSAGNSQAIPSSPRLEHRPMVESLPREEASQPNGSVLHQVHATRGLDARDESVRSGSITVAHGEFAKLRWIQDILAGCDSMHHQFHGERASFLWANDIDVSYDIDWRSISNRCLPDIVLVLMRDPSRVKFNDFPKYAIVPSVQIAIDLQKADWFEGVALVSHSRGDEVDSALNVLMNAASNSAPEKRDNAINAVARAKRLLLSNK